MILFKTIAVNSIVFFVKNAISIQQIPTLPAWVQWGQFLPYSILSHSLIAQFSFFSEALGSLKGFGDVRLLLIRARKISIRIRIRAFQLNVDFFMWILFYVV